MYKLCVLDRPTTVSTAVKLYSVCSKAEFPNVHVLLRIACTIPVTSCECKRTASSLRRLHTFHKRQWLRIASAVWHWSTFIITWK